MSSLLVTGGAVAMLFASAVSAQGAPTGPGAPSQKITVSIETVNGSGCPRGTAAVAVNDANTAFTITYSDYLAQVGAGADPTDIRKNCQLGLGIHIPQGFTYAIARVDYRGYAYLERGARGIQKASYYFQGSPETTSRTHEFTGPYGNNWQTADATDVNALVWAPCGEDRNFNANTELRVSAGSSPAGTTSFMAMDSTDGSVNTVYQLAWKEC